MEWGDVTALYRYWDECPAVHEIAAAWVGIKPRGEPAHEVPAADCHAAFREMIAPFTGAQRRGVA